MPRGQNQQADGDATFRGIAPRLDPALLEQGMASEARNLRFRNGVAQTRKGVHKPGWCNNLTPEVDHQVRPFGEIHGVGVFSNPSNLEFIIIAADGKTYYTRQNNSMVEMPLPGNAPATLLNGSITDADTTITVHSTTGYPLTGILVIGTEHISYTGISGFDFTGCTRGYNSTSAAAYADDTPVNRYGTSITLTGEVTFTQAFNKLIMWRGDDFAPLVLTSENDGFEDMVTHYDAAATYAVDDEIAFGPLVAVNTLTHSGTTATVTCAAAHGYATGADVTITGANETEFNGRFSVTVTSTVAFTYTVTSSNSAATGTMTCTNNSTYYKCTVTTSAGESPVTTSSSWSQLSTVLPNSTSGVFIANRIAAATTYDSGATTYGSKRDFVTVTDSLSLKTFFNQVFRVNYGTDSQIVDLLRFDENRLLVFKDKDVSMITGFIVTDTSSTLGTSVSIEPVIQNYGISSRGAAVIVGNDVYFWASRKGVVSLSQTEQSKVRGIDIPFSESIQPIVDRVDPRHEDKIRLAWYDSKLYVALPLDDGSNGNNALAVYDFQSEAWSGYDDGDAIKPKEFFTTTYNGAQRLFFVGTDGYINLIEENTTGDDVQDATATDGLKQEEITSYLLTRGYGGTDVDHRNIRTAVLGVGTWNPKYTVKAKPDGVLEADTLVTDRAKDRTTYYRPFDADAWVRSNLNDDFNTPYREDYSVVMDEDKGVLLTEDSNTLAQENSGGLLSEDSLGGFNLGTNGVAFNYMQETLEPFSLSPRAARYTQMEVTNTQGIIAVKQVTLTSEQGDRTITVKS